MRTLVLQLFNNKNRPTFDYDSNGVLVSALLDSGAETPVWCRGERRFKRAYPEAVKQDWESEIRGFGKDAEKGAVYIIPEFELTDGNEKYVIENLQLVVCQHPHIGYDFVMSDTMFAKTDTFVHRINNKYVEIMYEKERYQCAVKRTNGVFSIVVFSQEDSD